MTMDYFRLPVQLRQYFSHSPGKEKKPFQFLPTIYFFAPKIFTAFNHVYRDFTFQSGKFQAG